MSSGEGDSSFNLNKRPSKLKRKRKRNPSSNFQSFAGAGTATSHTANDHHPHPLLVPPLLLFNSRTTSYTSTTTNSRQQSNTKNDAKDQEEDHGTTTRTFRNNLDEDVNLSEQEEQKQTYIEHHTCSSNISSNSKENAFLQFVATTKRNKNKNDGTTISPPGGHHGTHTTTYQQDNMQHASDNNNVLYDEEMNQNYRTPFDILQIPTNHAMMNQKSKRLCEEEKHCQTYYDPIYYSSIVDHYITNDYYKTVSITTTNPTARPQGQQQNKKKKESDDDDDDDTRRNNIAVYNHPILGDMNLKLQTMEEAEEEQNGNDNNDRHFLIFPKVDESKTDWCGRRIKNSQDEEKQNRLLLGVNISMDSLLFPTVNKEEEKRHHRHSNIRTNLPIPLKTRGILKIVCYQGATVRTNFDIGGNVSYHDPNKKICVISKNDEREFVDVRWLSPYKSRGSNNSDDCIQMEESTSEDEDLINNDEALNPHGVLGLHGVLRYKIKLLDTDLSQNRKDESGAPNGEIANFGWISDRSRLKDNPYWIAIVV